jgi:hypothetical protein
VIAIKNNTEAAKALPIPRASHEYPTDRQASTAKASVRKPVTFVPFGIPSASNFLLDAPPALTTERYAKAYNEVVTVGSLDSTERPQDRADVVLFYAVSSPTLIFNQAAQQVAREQGRSLSENARALALVNMAISDSLVASFLNKYHYNFWRPEQQSMLVTQMATRKPIRIPASSPLSPRHVSRAIPPTTAAEVVEEPRF